MLRFQGDFLRFELICRNSGKAYLRTNLGHADLIRHETIHHIQSGLRALGSDWFDIPMHSRGNGLFELSLPLMETGHFQAKTFFFDEETDSLSWPEGANITINVEPNDYRRGNAIYCAFVRQFGRHKYLRKTWSSDEASALQEREHVVRNLEMASYSVIPPSGTFRDLIQELDHIFGTLKCKILHLLPIHPTPTVYGRMGRFGSPYAALDFFAVDPALAEFDPSQTPLDQFLELVDAVHQREGKLFLDIALNHTGWAAKLHETHPQWVRRDANGEFHRPGAWGVIWADLTELEHDHKELWAYLTEVLLTWCERGVDGFRCDAGYMIPRDAWRYIVARVRERFPDVVFLLEGLGGDPAITEDLINSVNLNWAYSELFQNYSKEEVTRYSQYAWRCSNEIGIMANYAETHDNNRLASVSPSWSRMRIGLCAWLSANGTFGFANGVEWFADEKIDVHRDSGLNWGSDQNQVNWISAINNLLLNHPCFSDGSTLTFMETESDDLLCFKRNARYQKVTLVIAVNLNPKKSQNWIFDGAWTHRLLDGFPGSASQENPGTFTLPPHGHLMLQDGEPQSEPDYVHFKFAALQAASGFLNQVQLGSHPSLRLAEAYYRDPLEFCRKFGKASLWEMEHDPQRDFVLPDSHALVLRAEDRFQVRFAGLLREAHACLDGRFYCVLPPYKHIERGGDENPEESRFETLWLTSFTKNKSVHREARIWVARPGYSVQLDSISANRDHTLFLDTNGRGAMLRAHVEWGKLASRYDALLAANLDSNIPVDRHVFLRRWRAWVRFFGHSVELAVDTTVEVLVGDSIEYVFDVPLGTGKWVRIRARIHLIEGENICVTSFFRDNAQLDGMLEAGEPITLIVRPDVEDRSFHQVTKAFKGPESEFVSRISSPEERVMMFRSESGHHFQIRSSLGGFTQEPQWIYNHHHSYEQTRGLEAHGDLFSPGFFRADLKAGEVQTIETGLLKVKTQYAIKAISKEVALNLIHESFKISLITDDLDQRLKKSMAQFVVKREANKTVIAGYPWFLDWGRDTFICARGLISAGFAEDVLDILVQFGQFVDKGTLPNMIHGKDASNRDTSDAPLWFIKVCKDLCENRGDMKILDKKIDGHNDLRTVVLELVNGYRSGTPNGIGMHLETGLIFSPSHFTWMDTNYPAGTPREGYPIEIQALWYEALEFVAQFDNTGNWAQLAEQVAKSIRELFWIEKNGFLADCLHAASPIHPSKAEVGDALRPNQLLAILAGILEPEQSRIALEAISRLVVPGGLRSLADLPVAHPLPVKDRGGQLLNRPDRPFWPRYEGDEDSRRKPAYHNGTVWVWPFPMYCEAIAKYGETSSRTDAFSILMSCLKLFFSGCLFHLPEVLDGASPHTPRGCDAQAWSITEFYRVLQQLKTFQGD